ncbi:hypothetical protein M758_11G141000 [Ceratodon purpureus]|nr:hypothetical protein M758_11G141000 [Ceratodon purpureus]
MVDFALAWQVLLNRDVGCQVPNKNMNEMKTRALSKSNFPWITPSSPLCRCPLPLALKISSFTPFHSSQSHCHTQPNSTPELVLESLNYHMSPTLSLSWQPRRTWNRHTGWTQLLLNQENYSQL